MWQRLKISWWKQTRSYNHCGSCNIITLKFLCLFKGSLLKWPTCCRSLLEFDLSKWICSSIEHRPVSAKESFPMHQYAKCHIAAKILKKIIKFDHVRNLYKSGLKLLEKIHFGFVKMLSSSFIQNKGEITNSSNNRGKSARANWSFHSSQRTFTE